MTIDQRPKGGMTSGATRGMAKGKAAVRLLAHLARPGHSARMLAEMPEEINLFITRKGMTLGAGRLSLAAAEALVDRDLAAWDGAGPRRALVITATGRAHLRRAQAAAGEEFLEQHRATDERRLLVDGDERLLRINNGESPLAWLRSRRDRSGQPYVDAACFEAGERLRADLTIAQMLPSVTMRWSAVPAASPGAQGSASASEAMIAARQRARRALQAVGSDFAGLLIDVCGFLKGVETIERERGWPARSGKVILRLALRRLAEAYGLAPEARGPVRSESVSVWRAPIDA
jgi:hypothetical protein